MNIDTSGIGIEVKAGVVTIHIPPNHPLIRLAAVIDWEKLKDIILPDLKASTYKGKWWTYHIC